MKRNSYVNVTLPKPEWYAEKKFPCPVCGANLSLRVARTQKPYCHCDACGIQLFFRGRNGIERLKAILVSGVQTSGDTRAAVLFYRVEQLKQQKSKLEDRRRLLSRNQDLENAITALDGEIEIIRSELAEESKSKRRNSK
jgi:predicted RNA-binding Zn-ribbon protein involved in translation (DUF1610 family)